MSTIQDPTTELEPPFAAAHRDAAVEPAPFDARRTAAVVAQDMALALQAWRGEPEARAAISRTSWLGAARSRIHRRAAQGTSMRAAVACAAIGAGLVGIVIGALLGHAHRHLAPVPHATPPAALAPVAAASGVTPSPTALAPRPSTRVEAERPDPIGKLYAEVEGRRLAEQRRRRARDAWGPVCPLPSGQRRQACLKAEIGQADQELRRSYQFAIERRVEVATLNRYRQTWGRLRRTESADPEALIGGYRRLAQEIREVAAHRPPPRSGRAFRRGQERSWYY